MADKLNSQTSQQQQQHLNPTTKLSRMSSDHDNDAGCVTMASPSPLMLGLGLSNTSKPSFTFMQLQELEHQALIYKYMAAGLPVPIHLVLPIWKTVAASSFGPYHFPSLMGYSSLCLDYRNSMEPEPGRCRRTDGKKWRCSRDVVPDHKYCERHMHRGRNRSRKPVETGGAKTEQTAGIANSGPRGVLKLLPSPGTVNNSESVSPPRLGFSPTSVLGNNNVRKNANS